MNSSKSTTYCLYNTFNKKFYKGTYWTPDCGYMSIWTDDLDEAYTETKLYLGYRLTDYLNNENSIQIRKVSISKRMHCQSETQS